MRRNAHLSPALLAGLAVLAGCNPSSSDGSLLSAGSTGAAVASGTSPGNLAGMQGQGSAFAGPEIEVLTPARAAYLPAGSVQLTARVRPAGAPIAEVHVDGLTTPVASDGTVQTTLTVQPGLNTIVVEAWDVHQHRSERHVSVLAGQFGPENVPVAEAGALRLTDSALDGLEPGIARAIDGQRGAIVAQILGSNPPKDTTFERFSFGQVGAAIDAVPGGLRFTIDVDDVALDIKVRKKFLFVFPVTKRGTVRANRLTLEGTATFGVQNGALVTQLSNVTSRVQGFSVPDWADDHEDEIRRGFTQAFAAQAAGSLDAELTKALQGAATAGTATQNVLGTALQIDWRLTSIAFDADGATAAFGASVQAAAPVYGSEQRSWITGTPLATLGGPGNTAWNAALALHQDALNQALHAAWRAGALQLTIDGATFAQLAPLATSGFDTTALLAAAPQLASVLAPGLPLEVELEGQLPPVVSLQPQGPELLQVALGSLKAKLSVIDPATGQRTPLVTAIYALRAPANLIEQNGVIALNPAGLPQLNVDVVGPALPGSEPVLEQVTATLAPQLLQAALGALKGLAVPTIKGTTLQGIAFQASGETLVGAGLAAQGTTP